MYLGRQTYTARKNNGCSLTWCISRFSWLRLLSRLKRANFRSRAFSFSPALSAGPLKSHKFVFSPGSEESLSNFYPRQKWWGRRWCMARNKFYITCSRVRQIRKPRHANDFQDFRNRKFLFKFLCEFLLAVQYQKRCNRTSQRFQPWNKQLEVRTWKGMHSSNFKAENTAYTISSVFVQARNFKQATRGDVLQKATSSAERQINIR